MRRFWRTVPVLFFSLALLTVPALADIGPKPQLAVRVENGPEEPYYLDILAEGTPPSDVQGTSGLAQNASSEDLLTLDQDLLDALRAAVPEGWHACLAQGHAPPVWGKLTGEPQNGVMLHTFRYVGVPSRYRLLAVSASGEIWLSVPTDRVGLQSTVTVDWSQGAVTENEMVRTGQIIAPPAWQVWALQFLSTFLPTLAIEGILLLLFGFSWKRNWKPFLLMNLLTQGGLTAATALLAVSNGVSIFFYLAMVPFEAVILLVETSVYRRALSGQSTARATAYGVTANLCSALLGLVLAEPVWRFVVSIS